MKAGLCMNGIKFDQLRAVQIAKDCILYPEGSVFFCAGNTKVLCNVTAEEKLPPWFGENRKHQIANSAYKLQLNLILGNRSRGVTVRMRCVCFENSDAYYFFEMLQLELGNSKWKK
jgi:hypothetical protein